MMKISWFCDAGNALSRMLQRLMLGWVFSVGLCFSYSSLHAESLGQDEMLRELNAESNRITYTGFPDELDPDHKVWTSDQAEHIQKAQACDRAGRLVCAFLAISEIYDADIVLMNRSCETGQNPDECQPFEALKDYYIGASLYVSQNEIPSVARLSVEIAISVFDRLGERRGYQHGAVVFHLPRAEACIVLVDRICAEESLEAIKAAQSDGAWYMPVHSGFVGAVFVWDIDESTERVGALEAAIQAMKAMK